MITSNIASRLPLFTHGFSTVGTEHLTGDLRGLGNQDSYGMRETDNGLVMVVADGCGSSPDSGTGSKAAVRVMLELCSRLLEQETILPYEKFFQDVEPQFLGRIREAASAISCKPDPSKIIYESYLFTVLAAVVTPNWTAIAGCGDGVFALNDELTVLEPREGNQPEYIAYKLTEPVPAGFEDIGLRVHAVIDTRDLESVFIGTDGMLAAMEQQQYSRGVFSVPGLWQDQELYGDSVALKRTMTELSLSRRSLRTKRSGPDLLVYMNEEQSIFHDDATFVVAVRDTAREFSECVDSDRSTRDQDSECAVEQEVVEAKNSTATQQDSKEEKVELAASLTRPSAMELLQQGQPEAAHRPLPAPLELEEPVERPTLIRRFMSWLGRILLFSR